ncbi:HlyD family secretion protein [Sphingobacterium sp. N143]|uniref:HlyD family secretion protein n=1 Tax=Sphingobacterium sp. N143 TaxID=2746727 RepID=UPI0025787B2A|nr:HlyD family secretion protein [Sphingobacterium sp. N143]MDM1296811.1 HlyD family secretion protein [Sphingobacterium sp. N143]
MKKKYTITDQFITKITGWIAGIIVVAMTIWGGYTLWGYYVYEQTNDAQVQEYVNPVISRAGGFVVAVRFEENQHVQKGDTLFLIDNREYVLQQEQTEASLQKAKAQLRVLESNIATLTRTASAYAAQVNSTKAKLWKQQLDYTRYQKLFEEESATQQKMEEVQATLDVNNSDYLSAQDKHGAALLRIEDIKVERSVVQAEIARLNSLLNRHKLDVSYTVIVAPYDGRMGRRTIEPGQMIDVGQPLAFIVNDETDKWIVANYKETQIATMQIGDTVKIIADAFPDRTFRGTIISLSPATGSSFSLLPPDNSTGNYVKIVQRVPVRIRVDGDRQEIDLLKVGMNVNVYTAKRQHRG